MSKRIYNIVRPCEGRDGKTRWQRHGVLIIDDDRISLHIDSLPVSEWNGWFNCYLREDEVAEAQNTGQPVRRGGMYPFTPQGSSTAAAPQDFDDDIPF